MIDYTTLLPYPSEVDGVVRIEDADLVTCYRTLLTLHELLANAERLPLPRVNAVIVGMMKRDLGRALVAIRMIQDMQSEEPPFEGEGV